MNLKYALFYGQAGHMRGGNYLCKSWPFFLWIWIFPTQKGFYLGQKTAVLMDLLYKLCMKNWSKIINKSSYLVKAANIKFGKKCSCQCLKFVFLIISNHTLRSIVPFCTRLIVRFAFPLSVIHLQTFSQIDSKRPGLVYDFWPVLHIHSLYIKSIRTAVFWPFTSKILAQEVVRFLKDLFFRTPFLNYTF